MGCCGDQPPSDNRIYPRKKSGEVLHDEYDDFEGPLKKRSCTDVFCLIIFVAFIGGMGYVGYLGWDSGDPYGLIYGRDSWGNICNKQNDPIPDVNLSGRDTTGLNRLFYFNFVALLAPGLLKSVIVCVSKCPHTQLETLSELQDYCRNNSVRLCRYDLSVDQYVNDTSSVLCPPLPVLEHENILNRCVPKKVVGIGESILGSITNTLSLIESQCEEDGDFWQRAARDIQSAWKELLYLTAIGVGVALVVTFLMGFLAAVIIWTLVIGTAIGSLVGTGFCWYTYGIYKKNLDAIAVSNRLSSDMTRVRNWLIYSILATFVTVILLLLLLVMFKRIALVVQLFREAGKAMLKAPMLLLQPLWTLLLLAATLAGLGYIFLYIETAGDPRVDSDTGYVSVKQGKVLFYMKWYYIFGLLWLTQFFFACHQMVIAGTIATWYFTRDKSNIGWPILASLRRLVVYHLGSVAFGAFIIALIQLFRIILSYIHNKLAGKTGPMVDFLFKCLQCCLWCFEKIMKFINANAYIMIAIYGYSFCKGAQRAFTLLLANILRVGTINSVGTFVLFLGKLGVAAVVIIVGLQFFKTDASLCYAWLPVLLGGLSGLLVAHCFLSVYGMAIDTIFLCFCEDCERNDGIARPYFMSKGLMEYVENSKEALQALKKRGIGFGMARGRIRRRVSPSEEVNLGESYPPATTRVVEKRTSVPAAAQYM